MDHKDRRTYRGKTQLVLFDWAGTTVDFGCQAPITAFVKGFKNLGIDVSMKAARLPMGMEKRAHIRSVADQPEIVRAWQHVHGCGVTEENIDSMFNEFSDLLLESIEAKSALLPGVKRVVETLRDQNIKIGASTGYFTEAANIVSEKAATNGYVPDLTICSSDVPAGRPAPWMIYRVMEALNVYPPEAVINVGDTPVDVAFGLNAGVWSVAVAETGNQMGLTEKEISNLSSKDHKSRLESARKSLYDAGAHWVINRMDELPSVVEKINQSLASGKKP